MVYFFIFGVAFLLAVILTLLIKKIALKFRIIDDPRNAPERKIQTKPIPLLGGTAVYLAFAFGVLIFRNQILSGSIELKNLIGVILGGLIIILGGTLDDKFNLPAKKQIIFPILATLVAIFFGIGIDFVTNPFGGLIYLDQVKFQIITLGGVPYFISLFSDLFTLIWLMVVIYAIKFLDGLDGLVSGVSMIGGLVVAGLCLLTVFFQPEVATLAMIFAGACAGFLVFNFHPAKIFLGEAGSFCGFMLGILAIISGGKIATTLLILGIPILDLIWVVFRRVLVDKKAPWKGDKKHLHFRLLELGFSHRGAVLLLYFIALIFGLVTIFFGSLAKLIALIILVILMIILAVVITKKERKTFEHQS